jgi:D-3-phosphoglycerate dehydrogenase
VATADWRTAASDAAKVAEVDALALFGGRLTPACVDAAPKLVVVGCNTDNTGHGLPLEALSQRRIPVVDTTAAWGQSVAEIGLGLCLAALRRTPQWHAELAGGAPSWEYEAQQYCDANGFVAGELGTKVVGVIGLGQIGGRIARWCVALGKDAATSPALRGRVIGYDPFLPAGLAESWGVERVGMDALARDSEVVVVAVPPTPTAKHLLDAGKIGQLRRGALVVIVTRAHAVDMDALRKRVVADELAAALDVYDVEPLPVEDPLRGRANVVHLPHIAGRTRDANLRTSDILADDFLLALAGERPRYTLTPQAIAARTGT